MESHGNAHSQYLGLLRSGLLEATSLSSLQAALIEYNMTAVDAAIDALNSALARGASLHVHATPFLT